LANDADRWRELLRQLGLALLLFDSFSDKALIYAVTSKGYAPRSVGPDMIDENGSKDDITANLP
jgi:hypothetical protein